jgi:predicted nuclease of restriction endonuclease-like (RecB) superfamily
MVSSKPARGPAPTGYKEFLADLKQRIGTAQTRAALAVSRELLQLYWQIGGDIVLRQKADGWGASMIERLARDLRKAFPGVEGFSASNIWRMRAFYLAYAGETQFLAQPVREIRPARRLAQPVREIAAAKLPPAVVDLPWGHHVALLEKVKEPAERLWYARQAAEHGWSRSVLLHKSET